MTRDEYIKLPDLKEMVDSDRAMRIKPESLKAQGKWDYYNNCPLISDKLRNEMLKKERMKREDIIRMAREAGFEQNSLGMTYTSGSLPELLERFAALVAAKEREECALIVEREASQYTEPVWAVEIVNDIRARGNK